MRSTEDKRFTLRIDPKIFEQVVESADKNKRAIGREIEFILEQYFANLKDTDEKSNS